MTIIVLEEGSLIEPDLLHDKKPINRDSFNIWSFDRSLDDWENRLDEDVWWKRKARDLVSYFFVLGETQIIAEKTEPQKGFPIMQVWQDSDIHPERILCVEREREELARDRAYHLALRYAKNQVQQHDVFVNYTKKALNLNGRILKPPFKFNPSKEDILRMSSDELLQSYLRCLESENSS